MIKKRPFGAVSGDSIEIGDIVQWSTWCQQMNEWKRHHGIITEIREEVRGNRLISVSMVMPLEGPRIEKKFFTPSLRLISNGDRTSRSM